MNIETQTTTVLRVPLNIAQTETIIKKSRFIARAFPIGSEADARLHIDDVSMEFPDARHVCWAYVLGHPNNPASMSYSDDGEPSGTAGKPIFNVIQAKAVANVCVAVIRYFGGVKLGAGGLIRAYAGAASSVIESLDLEERHPRRQIHIRAGFEFEASLRRWLQGNSGELIDIHYSQTVIFTVSVLDSSIGELQTFCLAQKAAIE